MKYLLLSLYLLSLLFGKEQPQYIDGVAALVEEHIILKSDLAQMVNMAAVQSGIDPSKDQGAFLRLQSSVLQSMVDQKILLEMAEIDSITVEEKEVDQSLEQQVQMLIAQAGGEKRAEEILGQSLSDFRREFWFDMRDRLVSEKYQQQLLNSINITKKWAEIARNYHSNEKQSLFGIVQGGKFNELREKSALDMTSLDFDGYAIGGLAIGETPTERKNIVDYTVDMLPEDKLRYVMGLGDIEGMLELIELGIDIFDCVWPARLARHGKIINKGNFFNLKNSQFKNSNEALVVNCDCYVCINFSKAYLRHLLINESTSSWFYLTLHNIYQTENILSEVRKSILNSEFENYKESILDG